MWVKSEYAGELAVLSAWLSVLLPWNVQYSQFGEYGSTLFVRFPFLQVQYTWLPYLRVNGELTEGRQTGFQVIQGLWISDPITAARAPAGVGDNITGMPIAWVVGAAVVAVAFVLSVALYRNEDLVESRLPVDPVRVMGGLLGIGALALGAATVLVYGDVPGFPFPVGAVVMAVLAVALLTVDRTDSPPVADPEVGAEET